jgi:hypothetical protein
MCATKSLQEYFFFYSFIVTFWLARLVEASYVDLIYERNTKLKDLYVRGARPWDQYMFIHFLS